MPEPNVQDSGEKTPCQQFGETYDANAKIIGAVAGMPAVAWFFVQMARPFVTGDQPGGLTGQDGWIWIGLFGVCLAVNAVVGLIGWVQKLICRLSARQEAAHIVSDTTPPV